MSQLRSLIRVLSAFEQSHDDVLRRHGILDEDTKIHELYHGIKDGRIRDDNEARSVLYPCKDYVPETTYASIKSRLTQSVIESIGEIDTRSLTDNDYARAYLRSLQYARVLRVLCLHEEYDCAQTVAVQLLRLSEKYLFTDETVVGLQALMECYASIGDRSKIDACMRDYNSAVHTRALERNAESECAAFHANTVLTWSTQTTLLPEIHKSIERIRTELMSVESHILSLSVLRLRQLYAVISMDYAECCKVRDEVELYYLQRPHLREPRLAVQFAAAAMVAAYRQGATGEAERLAVYCEEHSLRGTYSWFFYRQRTLIMALRSMKSTVAHSMYEEVIGNPGFKEMDERSRAVWSVLGIYVQVLGMSSTDPVVVREANESIELEYQEIERLNDQLQQGNVLKKDIQGLKVAAVVARVIAMFMRGDYDGMVRRDESLQTLRRKRLRALHRGLDVFLRCIHAMVESNFQFAECQRRTQRLSAELRARDTQRKSDNEMLEILPFDRLWEVMMRMLRERQEAGSAHNSGTAPLRK